MDKTERYPWMSEQAYFASVPNVAGMMTPDQRVILRPELQGDARDSVKINEMMRLFLQSHVPTSKLNDKQKAMFRGTPYETDEENALRSILARGVAKDPSANMDFSQDTELRRLMGLFGQSQR